MTTPETPGGTRPPEGGASKIRHNRPAFGGDDPVPVVESSEPEGLPLKNKIRAFETKRRHEEEWSRTPNTTGTGAIHVKTFHCKLTDDALRYLDQTINEWLDAHPQYEVKFVTSSVGIISGKLKEPHMICQVWV
jgi:hypothetical protein